MNGNKNKRTLYMLGMVLLWTVVFSFAMHSLVMGLCLGVAMGAVFGLYDDGKPKEGQKDAENAEDEATQDETGD